MTLMDGPAVRCKRFIDLVVGGLASMYPVSSVPSRKFADKVSRMESAVAVHTNGQEFALRVRMKWSIFLTRSAVETKEPRRMAR
jgi:hypothetical protein